MTFFGWGRLAPLPPPENCSAIFDLPTRERLNDGSKPNPLIVEFAFAAKARRERAPISRRQMRPRVLRNSARTRARRAANAFV
jgi:hypothetical protein